MSKVEDEWEERTQVLKTEKTTEKQAQSRHFKLLQPKLN